MTDDLRKRPANHVALSPVGFLSRAAQIWPGKDAVIDGEKRFSYAQFHARARRLAGALRARGVAAGETVAVIAPNTHMMIEAHFGVPMAGAVLNAINVRLDPTAVAQMLAHGEARLVLADERCAAVARDAAARAGIPLILGDEAYEALLETGSDVAPIDGPEDEWDPIALNYTSGTTGKPKGAVYHHRGAYLNAMSNALSLGLSTESTYLWTLPMFHCNGWSHPWAVTLMGGTHLCLPEVVPERIFALIARHRVTHMAGAPVVMNLLVHSAARPVTSFDPHVRIATGGAPPPAAIIRTMEAMGFEVIHLYGQTESYGPSIMCYDQPEWGHLAPDERAARMARQGQAMPAMGDIVVADAATGIPVPNDGSTLGEIMVRGNTVMKGYLKDPDATEAALGAGWLRSGDVAVRHPDGYIEIKDRLKDIIISGGENISSIEIEAALYAFPAIMEAAVVAMPHDKWGETPCAFVTLKPGERASEADIIAWCRSRLAHFKCPSRIVFLDLPKTATGKIRKVELRERASGGQLKD